MNSSYKLLCPEIGLMPCLCGAALNSWLLCVFGQKGRKMSIKSICSHQELSLSNYSNMQTIDFFGAFSSIPTVMYCDTVCCHQNKGIFFMYKFYTWTFIVTVATVLVFQNADYCVNNTNSAGNKCGDFSHLFQSCDCSIGNEITMNDIYLYNTLIHQQPIFMA